MTNRNRVQLLLAAAFVIVAAAAVAIITYLVSIEILAQTNRAEFASRPEVENWALPYVGTSAPAMVISIGVFLIAAAVGAIVVTLRSDRHLTR